MVIRNTSGSIARIIVKPIRWGTRLRIVEALVGKMIIMGFPVALIVIAVPLIGLVQKVAIRS